MRDYKAQVEDTYLLWPLHMNEIQHSTCRTQRISKNAGEQSNTLGAAASVAAQAEFLRAILWSMEENEGVENGLGLQ